MPSKIRLHTGKVLFQRLGTLQPMRQNYWKRAPAAEGLWAFPWPYFSMFFAGHQYRAITPRRLLADQRSENPTLGDEYVRWLREVAPRVLPIRKFWHAGGLFTHIDQRGHDLGLDEWKRVDVDEFAARAARFLTRHSRWPETGTPQRVNCFDIEALEVFIPTQGRRFEPAPQPGGRQRSRKRGSTQRGPRSCRGSRVHLISTNVSQGNEM